MGLTAGVSVRWEVIKIVLSYLLQAEVLSEDGEAV